MSILPQNHTDEIALLDCVQRFFSDHHVGKILKQCNGTKEKGVSAVSLLRYKLSNIFIGRSMYMQLRSGSFKVDFSKNTFYRFLNSAKTNWLRFTSLLAADIVNNEIRDLTDESRKNVFIIDDSLFNRTSCKKTELGSKIFFSLMLWSEKRNRFRPKSSVYEIKRIVRIGLLSYALTPRSVKRKSSVSMVSAGRSKSFSRPANPCLT